MKHPLESLPQSLLGWYAANKRQLPWRQDTNPYHIWVSEIMLQQTRVEAVKEYYKRFLTALPDIPALAACDDEKLHKLWEGLGYYSRVRNLKKAAIIIMETYSGEFPREYAAVLSLPGIGAYTAGAICSIAFGLPTPAVDGNVLRVMSRLQNDFRPIDLPAVKKDATELLTGIYPDNAGDFTQALMELGATLCGPNHLPECNICPCSSLCRSFAAGTCAQLPVKQPKPARKLQQYTVFIIQSQGKIAVAKRPPKGLLADLWEFPNAEGFLSPQQAMEALIHWGLHPTQLKKMLRRNHIFTHITWDMQGFYLEVSAPEGNFTWLTLPQIQSDAALPTAFRKFLEEIDYV